MLLHGFVHSNIQKMKAYTKLVYTKGSLSLLHK